MRLYPNTRERGNKSTASTATTEALSKHQAPEMLPGPQPSSLTPAAHQQYNMHRSVDTMHSQMRAGTVSHIYLYAHERFVAYLLGFPQAIAS